MYGLNYGYKTSVQTMVNHLKEKIKKLDRFGIFNKNSNFRYWFK